MRPRLLTSIAAVVLSCATLLHAQQAGTSTPQGAAGGTAQPTAPAPRQGGSGGTQLPAGQDGGQPQGRGGARGGRQGSGDGLGGGPFGGGRFGRGNREPVLGTAIIRGRVVAADTGTALRRAQVRAQNGQVPRTTTTDDAGRFELRDLPAGQWTVTAAKAGYVTLRFGQRRPSEVVQPIALADGQRLEAANFGLPRGAAVVGRITDDAGEPVAGVRVQALNYRMTRGQRTLSPVGIVAQTDDTGAFRIYGLGPGDYYVSARGDTGVVESADGPSSYAPTYFPGTTNVADAQRIALGVGQEQPGVSFALSSVKTVKVSGTVVDSTGMPMTNGLVALTTAFESSDSSFPLASNTRVRADGTFTLSNVVPGSYALQAASAGGIRAALSGNGTPEVAYLPLAVGTDDISGLTITTTIGGTITGTVAPEQGTGQLATNSIRITAQPVRPLSGLGGGRNARVGTDGTFSLAGVIGPQVMRLEGLPGEWMVARVEMNGIDVTDTPLDFKGTERVTARVTVTNRVPEITGTVQARQASTTGYQVVVFPADITKWAFSSRYLKSTRAAADGTFTIRGLPPADRYLAVAVDYLDEGEAVDPEFLERMRGAATSFSLREGEKKALDLKLIER